MGTLLHGKKYSYAEYVCMTLIGLGVALFGKVILVQPSSGVHWT